MLIDAKYRKCVTFLFNDPPNSQTRVRQKTPVATAFFVTVSHEEMYFDYVVTAKHVIDKSRPHGPLYVRLNMKAGGVRYVQADQDNWICHYTTDVAALPITDTNHEYDCAPVPVDDFATNAYIKQREINAGDEVFFVGLFSAYAGKEKNQSIVRFGNISLGDCKRSDTNL